jgi:hypothetical protein
MIAPVLERFERSSVVLSGSAQLRGGALPKLVHGGVEILDRFLDRHPHRRKPLSGSGGRRRGLGRRGVFRIHKENERLKGRSEVKVVRVFCLGTASINGSIEYKFFRRQLILGDDIWKNWMWVLAGKRLTKSTRGVTLQDDVGSVFFSAIFG